MSNVIKKKKLLASVGVYGARGLAHKAAVFAPHYVFGRAAYSAKLFGADCASAHGFGRDRALRCVWGELLGNEAHQPSTGVCHGSRGEQRPGC